MQWWLAGCARKGYMVGVGQVVQQVVDGALGSTHDYESSPETTAPRVNCSSDRWQRPSPCSCWGAASTIAERSQLLSNRSDKQVLEAGRARTLPVAMCCAMKPRNATMARRPAQRARGRSKQHTARTPPVLIVYSEAVRDATKTVSHFIPCQEPPLGMQTATSHATQPCIHASPLDQTCLRCAQQDGACDATEVDLSGFRCQKGALPTLPCSAPRAHEQRPGRPGRAERAPFLISLSW